MFGARHMLCVYALFAIIGSYGNSLALDCYVCRGAECNNLTEDHIQTCPSRSTIPSTTPGPDIEGSGDPDPGEIRSSSNEEASPVITITNNNNNIIDWGLETPEVAKVIRDTEQSIEESLSEEELFLVKDEKRSWNPPTRVHFRKLLQIINEEDDSAICVVASFIENDEEVIVRGCGFASEESEVSCRNVASEGVDSFNTPLESCSVCDTDLCNSATRSVTAVILVVIGVFINL